MESETASTVMEDSMMMSAASMARGNTDSDSDDVVPDSKPSVSTANKMTNKSTSVAVKKPAAKPNIDYGSSDSEGEEFDAKIRRGR